MTVRWNEALETGIEKIDSQHKELFERLNKLFEACNRRAGKSEVGSTLQFLEDYVATHFRDEEKLQQQYAYPSYQFHRKAHEKLEQTVKELKTQLEKEGPGVNFTLTLNRAVLDWLTNHITKMDKELASYIKSQNKKETQA